MKQKRFILFSLAVVALLTAIVGYAFSCLVGDAASGVTMAAAGMAAGATDQGMQNIEGMIKRALEEGATPIIDQDFEQTVVDMTPGVAPLDTMIRSIGRKRSVTSLNPGLYSIDIKPVEDVSTTAISGGTTVTSAYFKPGNQRMWSVGDTIIFKGTQGYDGSGNVTMGVPLWGYIYAVDAVNGLAIQPLNGKPNTSGELTFADAIAANTTVYRGSKPGTESQLRTMPSMAIPTDDFNYIHKFMTQVEVTEWSEQHAKKVRWGFAQQSERALKDYRMTKEMQYFLGARTKTNSLDPNETEPRYTCGGLLYFNPNTIDLSSLTTFTDADYTKLTQDIFDGNSGSETRILFAGSDFLTMLQNSQQFKKLLEAQKTELKGGVKMNSIETTYGTLLIKHHPLFRMMGWSNAAAVIDFENLSELTYESFRRLEVNFTKLAEKQAKGMIVWEGVCPEFAYPQTHAFITGPGGL